MMSAKSPEAFRTIGEVASWLGVPPHVLRFWESKFVQVKPIKRAGGRRYYRRGDMALLGGIKVLLHDRGMTIKGVQRILSEDGPTAVLAHAPDLEPDPSAPDEAPAPRPVAATAARDEVGDEPAASRVPVVVRPPAREAVANGAARQEAPRDDVQEAPDAASPADLEPADQAVEATPSADAALAVEPAPADLDGAASEGVAAARDPEDDGGEPGGGEAASAEPRPPVEERRADVEAPADDVDRDMPRPARAGTNGHARASADEPEIEAPAKSGAEEAPAEKAVSAEVDASAGDGADAPAALEAEATEDAPAASGEVEPARAEAPGGDGEPDVGSEPERSEAGAADGDVAPEPEARRAEEVPQAEPDAQPDAEPDWRAAVLAVAVPEAVEPRTPPRPAETARRAAARAHHDAVLALLERLEAVRERMGP